MKTKVIVSDYWKMTIDKNYSKITDPIEETNLIIAAQSGDKKAIHKLVSSQLLTIISMAKSFKKSGTDIDDLIGCGVDGVMVAIKQFDTTRNIRFVTYATKWIMSKISIYVHEDDLVQIPLNKLNDLKRERKLIERGKLQESEASFSKHSFVSLHDKSGDRESLNIDEILGFDEHLLDDIIERKVINRLLENNVNPKEKRVIELFFGLNGEVPHNEEEVGKILGITKQRVSQIKQAALLNFRKKMTNSF